MSSVPPYDKDKGGREGGGEGRREGVVMRKVIFCLNWIGRGGTHSGREGGSEGGREEGRGIIDMNKHRRREGVRKDVPRGRRCGPKNHHLPKRR